MLYGSFSGPDLTIGDLEKSAYQDITLKDAIDCNTFHCAEILTLVSSL